MKIKFVLRRGKVVIFHTLSPYPFRKYPPVRAGAYLAAVTLVRGLDC